MTYILLFIAITLLILGLSLFTIRPSRDQRAALDRVKELSDVHEVKADDDSLLEEDEGDSRDWVRKLLGSTSLVLHIEKLIQQADSETQVDAVLYQSVGAAFAGFLLVWFLLPSWLTEVMGFMAGGIIPYLFLRVKRNRRMKAFDLALPDAMDVISRSLKAGHADSSAFEIAVDQAREPVASEFRILTARIRHGMDMREAYTQLAERVPTADLRIFITAVLVQLETGGNLPHVLDRLTATIRVRTRLLGEMRAKTAQKRLTGLILIVLPLFLILVMKVTNPGYIDPFFASQTGKELAIYSLCSWIIGGALIYRITKVEV